MLLGEKCNVNLMVYEVDLVVCLLCLMLLILVIWLLGDFGYGLYVIVEVFVCFEVEWEFIGYDENFCYVL